MAVQELDTEIKIKEAARIIFQQKGFAATKTRDIAEASGINLALLNYYFRSKKKLFDIIMTETMHSFFSGIVLILNNEHTTITTKVEEVAVYYIDLLSTNPNVAPFILNTVREHPEDFLSKMGHLEDVKKSVFVIQFLEEVKIGKIPPLHPIHFMMNLMGLVVFPFIAQPMISAASGIPKESFMHIINERKKLIPKWIEAMLSVK